MAVQINVQASQAALIQSIAQGVTAFNTRYAGQNQLNLQINSRSFSQPLGRITSDLADFESALKASNARVLAFGASTAVLGGVVQTFKEIATTTVEVEKSLTDINRVLNLSTGGLQKFSTDLFGIAQQTSSSFQDAAKAALEFSRQGLGAEQTLKRTADAMTLVRLTGIDSARAVEDLTATVNGFSKSGLTTSQIVNKLAAVEQDFAVSATDLTEALSRTGQAAQESGVGFDQLNALVTAAQESTARGGAVIGNALKTIFTRLQRTETLDQLENFNIAVRDIEGNILPAVQILQNFAGSYNNLADAQRAQLAEQVAGVYQVNILKSIINDLNNSQGTYVKSLERGSMASNEAQIANEKLNQTLSALVSQTGVGLQQLANNIGKVTFEPIFKSIVSPINDAVQYINETLEGEGPGSVFANGILKGIRNVITGPGLAVAFAVIAKVAKNTFEDATKALPAILGLTTEAQKRANVEQSILRILQGQGQISQALIGQQGNSAAQAQLLLNLAKAQTAQYQQQLAIAQQLASTLVGQGVTVGSRGLQVGPKIKSAGHIPEASAHAERMGAMAGGYKPGKVIKAPSSIGNAIMNSAEKVKYVPGFAQPFINPPANSKAGRAHRQKSIKQTGVDPYMAGGFVPNFADKITNQFTVGRDFESSVGIDIGVPPAYNAAIDFNQVKYKPVDKGFNPRLYKSNSFADAHAGNGHTSSQNISKIINYLGENYLNYLPREGSSSKRIKLNDKSSLISTESILGDLFLRPYYTEIIGSGSDSSAVTQSSLISSLKPTAQKKLLAGLSESEKKKVLKRKITMQFAQDKVYSSGFIPNFVPPTSAIRVPWFKKFANPAYDNIQPTLGISKASDVDTFRQTQFRSTAKNADKQGDPNIFGPLYEAFGRRALQLVNQSNIFGEFVRGSVLQPKAERDQTALDEALLQKTGIIGFDFKGFPKNNLSGGSVAKHMIDKYNRVVKTDPEQAAKIKEAIMIFNEPGNQNQLPSEFGKNFIQLAGTSYSEMLKNSPDLVKALSVETNNLLNSYVKNPAFARMESSSGFIPNFAGKEIATKFFRTKTGFGELFPSEGTGLSGTVYKKSGYKLYGYQLKEHLNNMVMAILGNNVFIPDASYINPRTTTDVNKTAESSARVAALRLSSGGKTAPIGLERGMMSEAFGNAKYVFNPNAVYTGEVSGRMKRVNYDRLSDVLGVFWSQNPETKSAWESLKNASETGKYEKKEDVKAKTTILKNAYNKWLSANQYIGTRVKLSDYRQGVEGVRGANYAALRSDLAGVSNLQNLGEAEKIEKLKKQGVFYGDYKNNKASYDKLGRWSYDAASKKMFLNHAGFIPNFADGLGGNASLMRQALGLMPFVVDLKRGTYAEGDMFHYEIANKKFLNPETKKPIYGTLSPEDIHGSRYADTLVRGFYNASTGKVDFELTETQKKDKDFMKRNSTLLDKVKARYADRFKSSIPVKAKRVSPLSAFRNDGFIPNFADPKYITETLKRIKAGTSGFSAQEQQEFLSKFGTQKTMVASKQQVLKSKMLMSRMVDKLGLDYINSRTVDQLNKDVKNGYMSGALNFDVPENLSFIAAKGFVPNFAYETDIYKGYAFRDGRIYNDLYHSEAWDSIDGPTAGAIKYAYHNGKLLLQTNKAISPELKKNFLSRGVPESAFSPVEDVDSMMRSKNTQEIKDKLKNLGSVQLSSGIQAILEKGYYSKFIKGNQFYKIPGGISPEELKVFGGAEGWIKWNEQNFGPLKWSSFAKGFIPNFAYKQAVMSLEESMSGDKAIFDTKPFPHIRNRSQPTFASAIADHGGLNNALNDSIKGQKAAGLISKGFVPNFATLDAQKVFGTKLGALKGSEQQLFVDLNKALSQLARNTKLTTQQQQQYINTVMSNAASLATSTKSTNIVNEASQALATSLQQNKNAQLKAAAQTKTQTQNQAQSKPQAVPPVLPTQNPQTKIQKGIEFGKNLAENLGKNVAFAIGAPMLAGQVESAIQGGRERYQMSYGERLASTGASSAISGGATGAMIGAAIPIPGGAAIGAVLGAMTGLASAAISARTNLEDLSKSLEATVTTNKNDIELAKTIGELQNRLASETDPFSVDLIKMQIEDAASGIKNAAFAEKLLQSSGSISQFNQSIKEFAASTKYTEQLQRIPASIQSLSKKTGLKAESDAETYIFSALKLLNPGLSPLIGSSAKETFNPSQYAKDVAKAKKLAPSEFRGVGNIFVSLEKDIEKYVSESGDKILLPAYKDFIQNINTYIANDNVLEKLQPLIEKGILSQQDADSLAQTITNPANEFFRDYIKNLSNIYPQLKQAFEKQTAATEKRAFELESLKDIFAKINNQIENELNSIAIQLSNVDFTANVQKLNIDKLGGVFDTAANAISKNLQDIAKNQLDYLMSEMDSLRQTRLLNIEKVRFDQTAQLKQEEFLTQRKQRVKTVLEAANITNSEQRIKAQEAIKQAGETLEYDFQKLIPITSSLNKEVKRNIEALIEGEKRQQKTFINERDNAKALFDLDQEYAEKLNNLKKKFAEEDLKLQKIRFANLLKERQVIESFNLANQTIQNRTQAEITAMTIPMEVNPNFFAGMSRFQQEDYKFRLDVEKERKQLASNIRTATNEATLAQFQQKILISNTDATYENTKAIRESTIELLKQRLDKSVALESRLKDIQPKIQEQAQEQTQIQAQTEIAQAIASIIPAQESLAQSYRNTFEQDNDLYPLRTNILPDLKSEYEYNDAHIEEFLSKRKRDDESIRKMSQEYSDSLEREVKKGSALEILTSTEKLVDYLVSAVDKAAETFVNYYNTPAQSLPQRIPVTQQNFNREQAKNSSQRIPIAQQNFSGRGQPIVYLNQNSATDEILKNKTSNARNTEVPQKIDQQVQTNPLAEISGNEISNAKNRVVSQNIKIKLESDLIRDQIAALESLNKPSLSPKSNVADVEPNISKLLSETKEYENLTTQIIELERSKQLISEELTKNQETALLTIEQQEQKASQLKIISEEVRRLEDTREKSLNKIVELRRKEAEYVKFIESRGKIGTGIRKATADMSSDIEMFGETLGGTITTSFRDGLVGAMNAAANETDNLENALLGVAANFLKAIQGAMFTQIANQITTSLFPTGPVNAAPTATLPGSQRGGIIRAQTGGFIRAQNGMYISGGRTGDKNPALLEDGEYVLNRNAVKAMGGPRALDRLNFNIAPRFAAGGDPGSISAAIQLAEPYSRLSAFGRENSPEYQAYMDRLREEEAARQQKKAQRKALVRQFVGTLISTGITMGITQGFSAMKESAAANANLKGATGSLANGTTTDVTSFADAKNLINSGGSVKLVDGSVLTKSNFGTAGISKSTFNEIAASRFAASGIKVTPSGGLFGKTNYTVEKTGASGPNYGMKATRSFNNPYEAFSARNAFTPGYQSVNSNFGSFYNPSFPKIGGRQEGGLLKFNSGGFLPYGNRLNDTIPALLSGGEYVVNSRAVKKYGVGGMNRINAGVAKFQEGGLVDSSVDMNTPSNTTNTSNSNISINITVNANNNGKTDESQDSSGEGTQGNAKELSNRIKAVVLEVISTEQRTGGLLDSTKKK